jgi:hypothetical protein
MSGWIEADTTLLVECSRDIEGRDRYRFWDINHAIPNPVAGTHVQAQVFLDGHWQDMFFNDGWGRRYDPVGAGTWLKQKAPRRYYAEKGRQSHKVRYAVAPLR